tara:strand:+ start:438 stop:917 length:480 start_codon:yes stop_codon:yes gene_type:complete
MANMQLIMENWNSFVILSEASRVDTVGDLRNVVKLVRAKAVGGKVGKKAASILVGMLPGGSAALEIIGAAKDAGSLIKKLFGADDKYRTGTGLDLLNVDDDISKIVDDPIEVAYLNYLIKDKFKSAPDEESLEDFNVTTGLRDFIASKFNNKTVTAVGG